MTIFEYDICRRFPLKQFVTTKNGP
jgi:hypothetical protein